MSFVRGINPIWSMVDLNGLQLDDTYYLFILQNTLPYLPQPIFQDMEGNVPWSDPIEFLANGTLPENMYWNDELVYRLEVRQGNTQADALIYLIQNYVPQESGGTPVGESLDTDNMITNPQFALVSFTGTLTSAESSIEIARGWVLAGAGGSGSKSFEVTQVALEGQENTPTNAPYALQIITSGWATATLTQTFEQNGALWANEAVSVSVTASSPENVFLNAYVAPSVGDPTIIISNAELTAAYDEFVGSNSIPASTNTDVPPDASTDLILSWTGNSTVSLTSIQLIGQADAVDIGYGQSTIERQIDQTFHIYADSLIMQPKESLLSGWNFGLNPWQFTTVASTNVAANQYTADQTVIVQQKYVADASGNNVAVGQGSLADNYGFTITAVTATNQLAMIQYIAPATMRQYWEAMVSSLVTYRFNSSHATANVQLKMRLIYRAALPGTISQADPIATWVDGEDPTFAAGWTEIIPRNDPAYTITNSTTVDSITFEGFELPTSTNANMTLAIVLYTVGHMNSSATADYLVINDVSLAVNDFAIATPVMTPGETLRRCQYYYETSYPGASTGIPRIDSNGGIIAPMNPLAIGDPTNNGCYANAFGYVYKVPKMQSPTLTFYSISSASSGLVRAYMTYTSGGGIATNDATLSSYFNALTNTAYSFQYVGKAAGSMITPQATSSPGSAAIIYQFTADARMGV